MSLESQVADLVTATTDLLAAVNVSKSTLDASTTSANDSAVLAGNWATKTDGAVANGEFSAKKHAVDAGTSASAAAASASAAAQSALDVGSLSGAILNVTSPNGVAYLNGSNVLTSGSALTFDGTNLGVANTSGVTSNLTTNQAAGTVGSPLNLDLNFKGYINNTMARIRSWDESGSTGYGYLTFWTNDGSTLAERYRITQNGTAIWSVSGSEQMRLDSTGLAVTGALSATGLFSVGTSGIQSSGTADLVLESRAAGAGVTFIQGATTVIRAGSSGSYANYGVFSPTGLSVTGTLSATGNLSLSGAGTGVRYAALLSENASYAGSYILQAGGGSPTYGGGVVLFGNSHATYPGAVAICASAGANGPILLGRGGIGPQGSSWETQATLDASGNLGLGVTPSAGVSGHKAFELGTTGVSYASLSQKLGNDAATALGWNLYGSANSVGVGVGFTYKNSGDAASLYAQSAGEHKWFTAPSGTAGNAITFGDAKMTLDASGNLLVGGTTFNSNVDNNQVLIGKSGNIYYGHKTGTPSGAIYAEFNYAGVSGGIGSITQNGTTAVAYNTTSDHRLKTNVRPADALRFMDIEFVDFEWTDGRHDCGVIAHQLASIYPDLVLGEKDATEVRTVEITPAVPAVTEQRLVTPAVEAVPAVLDEDGNEVTPAVSAQEAVYETVEISPAVPAVTEEQSFPVYQQVNYMGLIGRMGTKVQQLQRALDALEARLAALEAA